ncbi:nucleotidyltransferase domain-containing protein [Halobacillus amylolyticus]|uniref:Amino acid transporter n=1 Tax=Halobacillus amylolyticus TaxID=2932259 RepID=A0ABY4H671_9BACI|nr:hypothetical protein [Halobacillus amylolyticus]UOR10361.1 hypothetical protein MUO15_11685 [Halobacillus amylolyticus]
MFDRCLQVKDFMESYSGKWMVAGGWAIDLHIGEETREHEDIEVAVFRDEQTDLASLLADWDVYIAQEERRQEWDLNDPIELPIHEIHASRQDGEMLEVLLNERSKGRWVYRRDPNLSFPLSMMNLQSEQGIPYLNPEIVLLYKAKHTRDKDHDDFNYVFPYLNEHQKEWLKQALMHSQRTHPWLEKLLY